MDKKRLNELLELADLHEENKDNHTIKLIMNENKILTSHTLPGVNVDAKENDSGIEVKIIVDEGTVIDKPVQFCFGILHNAFEQNIDLDVRIKEDAKITVVGHCIFIGDKHIVHNMQGNVVLEKNADFTYIEKHIHSDEGTYEVYPNATIHVGENARYKTTFELLRGRVGTTAFNYHVTAEDDATVEMEARMSGKADDHIKITEDAHLKGARSRAVLKSRVAVRDEAQAEVYNTIIADGESAKGHVDCSEILQDNGSVQAYPNVQVHNPNAHVTHEASLGGVDNKQLETLMARGLTKEEAEEVIINGLLS
jgi:Fe-S cluster assembly scaffold protein SufB